MPAPPAEVAPIAPDMVDWAKVFETANGDRHVVATMVDAALEESPRLLATIRDAIDSGKCTALRLAAHTLRGSLQYFGAAPVVERARQLERMGQDGDLSAARDLLAGLEADVTRCSEALASFKQHAQTSDDTSTGRTNRYVEKP